MMYTIHDHELVARLEIIAAQESRSIEDLLKIMIDIYSLTQTSSQERTMPPAWDQQPAPLQAVLHKAYEKARHYWVEHGEMTKAALTDQEMYEQFGCFDKADVLQLRSELDSLAPQPGSLAYTAWMAHQNPLALEAV